MKKYDYILVGSGLYAGVWAYEARKRGKSCLVVEKRGHIGGNVYCEDVEGIHVHRYGAHIFHTSDRKIWNYVNQTFVWRPAFGRAWPISRLHNNFT